MGSEMCIRDRFETILRHNMHILIVVMNDGAYGSEIHKLRAEGLPGQCAVFGRPDFASIAEGFGATGSTVTKLDALPGLIQKFSDRSTDESAATESAATGGLSVIDVHVSDKVVSPVIQRSHKH